MRDTVARDLTLQPKPQQRPPLALPGMALSDMDDIAPRQLPPVDRDIRQHIRERAPPFRMAEFRTSMPHFTQHGVVPDIGRHVLRQTDGQKIGMRGRDGEQAIGFAEKCRWREFRVVLYVDKLAKPDAFERAARASIRATPQDA